MDKRIPIDLKGTLSPRPYARLLTMIGDQLIKNEKIALFELIKNSYDADADWVQVRLNNFKEVYDNNEQLIEIIAKPDSFIEIEDDGHGMSWEVLSDAWMNPASPIKYLEKKKGSRKSPQKKRLLQGEKGIGRFAVFKIGSTVEITTRTKNGDEISLFSDLSKYDQDLFTEVGKEEVKYLDQINYNYEIKSSPEHFVERTINIQNSRVSSKSYGTLIKISNLKKGGLDLKKIDEIINDVNKLSSPFSEENVTKDFIFDLLINNSSRFKDDKFKDKLDSLLEKAPLKVTNGNFDNLKFEFNLNGNNRVISFETLSGFKVFKDRFIDSKTGKLKRDPECGPFKFQFYIFDLGKDAPLKYHFDVNDEDKTFIKNHRIYLYRDGVRVYPYGDPNDDWIGIDVKRGITRAGDSLSNDQTIGYLSISNESNPDLKDKTNREGLLEIGNSYEDFITLIQSFFAYLHKEFIKYKDANKDKSVIQSVKKSVVPNQLDLFKEYLSDKIEPVKRKEFADLVSQYHAERKYLIEKAEISEDLASVGLTVEAASHDLMTMIRRAKETMDFLMRMSNAGNADQEKITENLEKLRGEITFIEDQIKGIQPVFRSSRRKKKDFRISEIIKTVRKYYDVLLNQYKIELKVEEVGAPLVIRTNEAVLLQTFINLIDNAVYWLSTVDKDDKQISIMIDGNNYEVVFADNGPGISEDDEPYIFESFFSTKGDRGRGLGLYIARQLLERNEFSIEYGKNKKILSGANFLVDFNTDGDN
ncbi:sensor histidine kinase [Flavobacterium filum]|uniref:sensor histidine kinase n=1 Tax=Flavobacterium filum TaxID=370974 RepID=UPI000555E389|nr:sensor histidine kinase [Flavobacterium filum]